MNRYRAGRSIGNTNTASTARAVANARLVIAAVLVVSLALSLILGVPAIKAKNNTHDFIVRRMAAECKTAYDLSQSLSLTASTSSYEKLARIRSCVYGMEMLGSTQGVMEGRSPLDEGEYTAMYKLIEDYNTQLITGMSTAANITDLQNALEALYQKVLTLQ